MGACHSGLAVPGDEAAGPVLHAPARDRQEGSEMVLEEIIRIMRLLRDIEREVSRSRPDLGDRLHDVINQLGDLNIEIDYFQSDSE